MNEETKPLAPARAWQLNAIIALLVLLIAVSLFHGYQPEDKWEYTIGNAPDKELNDAMNRLGADGWELVFARRANSGLDNTKPDFQYEMIFRRRVKTSLIKFP